MKNFLALVASFILFLSITTFSILFNTSRFLGKETITKTVQKISIVELAKEQTPEAMQMRNMLDTLYKKASNYGIDEKSVNEIIDSDPVKEYVGEMASRLSTYLLTGEKGEVLTKEKFNQMFDKNMDQVLERTSLNITERQKEEFKGFIEENSSRIIEQIPTVEKLSMQIPAKGIQSLRIFFSSSLKIGCIVAMVLSVLCLIFLYSKDKKWLKYIGVPVLISSLFLFAFGLVLPVIFKVISDLLEGYIVLVFGKFLKPYAYQYIGIGLLGILVSVILLGIYAKIKKKYPQKTTET